MFLLILVTLALILAITAPTAFAILYFRTPTSEGI